jgi:hypothetical protein
VHIDWPTLAAIAVVAAAAALSVVLLVSLALVGWSARSVRRVNGSDDGRAAGAHTVAGLAAAVLCTLATGLIVCYGLYLIIA